ncbi:hypothetical protein [Paenibacillus ferrarius]|uniref:hypothetical protein n=1 Tax=Paenibacillus ferrarius TaxID=1469647 RepID=UPI003D2C465E
MSFNWNKYHTLAQELSQKPGEENKRSAISRAYYSVYCIAYKYYKDNLTNGLTIKLKDASMHTVVWDAFKKNGNKNKKTIQKLGILGERLKEARKKADYEEVIQEDISKVTQKAMKEATEAHTLFQQLLGS